MVFSKALSLTPVVELSLLYSVLFCSNKIVGSEKFIKEASLQIVILVTGKARQHSWKVARDSLHVQKGLSEKQRAGLGF